MAAIAFDPLEYTHQLEASGVPREQAEVHAKAMTAMFLHNFDALVTKDYLDSRFNEFETRIVGEMDRRFAELISSIDKRFGDVDRRFGAVDARFAEMEASIDARFAELEANMDKRFAEMEASTDKRFVDLALEMDRRFAQVDVRFERMDGRFNLLYWMQGITLVCVVIPLIHRLLG
ncbi:hypothetical protein F0M18_17135 [Pseudohalioglobus sediminis]|uniref:DUF1640 domain-containing protein n=1 Tax=Pseudohalioglobus sediminis TaxID=2606449 RepID=A0A5B0WQR2_9GAMM|nr:hypothetical protein [Pseudohalioglobus sediminis]KAA1188927.1 hypothetical protein F0M18_17135 [Pseudohalioglobus sediminis]